MSLHNGIIISATSLLKGTFFEDAVICIVEQNENGSIGFMLNKKYDRVLNELEEFKHVKPFPLFIGGPVDQEHLFFIHKAGDLIHEGQHIFDSVFYGGNFYQAITSINNGALTEHDVKIFIGYCGWDANELEEEIEEGSWTIEKKSIFTAYK